jgi:twitching motility protein PilT
MEERLKEILQFIYQEQASDLHLIPGSFPIMRKDGDLFPLAQFDIFTPDETEKILFSLLDEERKKRL